MAYEIPFYLYKRKLDRGVYWYVRFKNMRTSEVLSGKSIEHLRKKMKYPGIHHITRKMEADRIAQYALDSGYIRFGKDSPPFKAYVLEWLLRVNSTGAREAGAPVGFILSPSDSH